MGMKSKERPQDSELQVEITRKTELDGIRRV